MIQDTWKYDGNTIPDDILLEAMRKNPINEKGNVYCDVEKVQEEIQKAYIRGRMDERKLKN